MTSTVAELMTQFEAAAAAAKESEDALRRQMTAEIARLERNRAFAFRRTRLIRTLVQAASAAETEDDALAAQRRAVCNELGWEHQSDSYGVILARLQPVGKCVWNCACKDGDGTASEVLAELSVFETWFEETNGKSFYVLFDQYYPEVPVVDF